MFLLLLLFALAAPSLLIHPNARWVENGITVAGGNGRGDGYNQLSSPSGLYVDDEQTIYVADSSNHRIVEWRSNAMSGQVVAGGNGVGNGLDQLIFPTDLIVDKERDSLMICDYALGRVTRWSLRNGRSAKMIILSTGCLGLTMDNNQSLYVSDPANMEVRRYRRGESQGAVVAGGNGEGNSLDQLNRPRYLFVDRDHSVYVSDRVNNRVMKWIEDAKQGIVVAGDQGRGKGLTQLSYPEGVVVDQWGNIYVADSENHRIMCWYKGAQQGIIIVGGNGNGNQTNQLSNPIVVSFDRFGNLYVLDHGNNRVQKFHIDEREQMKIEARPEQTWRDMKAAYRAKLTEELQKLEESKQNILKMQDAYRASLQQEQERLQTKREEFERARREWDEKVEKSAFDVQLGSLTKPAKKELC